MPPRKPLPPLPDYSHNALIGFRVAAGTIENIDEDEASLSAGELVRRRRELLGYKRTEFAQILGIKTAKLRYIETYPGYVPPRSVLASIEDLLAIDRRKFVE